MKSDMAMQENYEPSNPLCLPFECFTYDSMTKPFPIEVHWHYFAEVILAEKGTLLISGKDTDAIPIHPGEAYFICPQVAHSIHSDGGDVEYTVIKMDMNQLTYAPSYAPNIKSIFLDAEQKNLPVHFNVKNSKKLQIPQTVHRCLYEYKDRSYGYDIMIRSWLYILCTRIIRFWMQEGFMVQNKIYQSDLLASVDSITAHIDRHIRDALRVEDLAEFCGMSYPGFAKKFKEIYGISCKEYISSVRVAKVEHYLLFTNADLTYISAETGYADCSHMIKDFKRLKGITPGRFRTMSKEPHNASAADAVSPSPK